MRFALLISLAATIAAQALNATSRKSIFLPEAATADYNYDLHLRNDFFPTNFMESFTFYFHNSFALRS